MFKDLQRLIQQSQQEQYSIINSKFEKLQSKPFWIWDIKEHKQEDANTSPSEVSEHQNIRVLTIFLGEVATKMWQEYDFRYYQKNKSKMLQPTVWQQKLLK